MAMIERGITVAQRKKKRRPGDPLAQHLQFRLLVVSTGVDTHSFMGDHAVKFEKAVDDIRDYAEAHLRKVLARLKK